jgi:hypothetical protein
MTAARSSDTAAAPLFHPLADLFPLLEGAEINELVEDIRTHGVRESIWLYEDKILDGRNRYRAAAVAGVPCPTRAYEGDDPLGFVISLNLKRRHLSESQRAMVAAKLATLRQGARTDLSPIGEMSQAAAAELLNVGKRSVERAKIVHEQGEPELVAAVEAGEISVSGAVEQIRRGNGARATMASRHEPDESLDYFPTPPWATRALIERVLPVLGIRPADLAHKTGWESACGEGHMAEPLAEYFGSVIATDIHDYGYGEAPVDFLSEDTFRDADWCITNPPFDDKAIRFVLRALKLSREGVAVFVRLQWLETIERYELVFRDHPPTLVAVFVERVNLCKGRWEPDGSTATAYCWLVWIRGEAPRPPFWIPPTCREQLTRPDDW